jgi:hypothetical protein
VSPFYSSLLFSVFSPLFSALGLCAITLTSQKPARLIRMTKTKAMVFMAMRC